MEKQDVKETVLKIINGSGIQYVNEFLKGIQDDSVMLYNNLKDKFPEIVDLARENKSGNVRGSFNAYIGQMVEHNIEKLAVDFFKKKPATAIPVETTKAIAPVTAKILPSIFASLVSKLDNLPASN